MIRVLQKSWLYANAVVISSEEDKNVALEVITVFYDDNIVFTTGKIWFVAQANKRNKILLFVTFYSWTKEQSRTIHSN